MTLEWKNLDETNSYTQLRRTDTLVSLSEDLTAERVESWKVPAGAGLTFHYGASMVTETDLERLQSLSDEQKLIEKYKVVLNGEKINTGEGRRVLHQLTRGQVGEDVVENGKNLRSFYTEQNTRVRDFVEKVHSGTITGSTGKVFDTVVQIGIGGSDLGPRALYLALKQIHAPKMKAFFVSNIDPDDAADVISLINPETTLFILVSKSGTTQETLANRDLIIAKMKAAGVPGYDPSGHIIAVTSKTSPLAGSSTVLDSFYIDDYIGGRYSSTSAVGGAVLSLALGPSIFNDLLTGANEADKSAVEPDILKNASLLDALIGVFNRNVLGLPATAVLPYSQALSRFPAHLQQLDMESNGKSVNRRGEAVSYPTGPIVFGEPGTNGQHSFYQLLHQGTDVVPLQFVGFRQSQAGEDVETDGSTSQTKLNANLVAQIIAFAKGSHNENPNKNFDGMRPSTLLSADRLDSRVLGALLAHFENKVMFQGFCWNLNSFDQEGVQLGKVLTRSVLDGSSEDGALQAFASILGIK
ncbi:MAG: glucose-6-phosphate isomerase [Spirochaetaceae bacterium]|nr:glucose-6-phosphate isomerase [Spirochaetaceae bacterium]